MGKNMAVVTLNFDIIGTHEVDFDIEDYENELDKPWEEMTEDEKIDFCIQHLEDEGYETAVYESVYNIGELEGIVIDGEEHYLS